MTQPLLNLLHRYTLFQQSLGSRLVNGNTLLPMKDIDITVDTVDTVDTVGKRWPGIGTNNDPYNGRFNGNGHTVTLMDADTENLKRDHEYVNGQCIYCGKQAQPAYTVTIPATVELGNAASTHADITAEKVTLLANQTLMVTIINGINGTNSTNGINGCN